MELQIRKLSALKKYTGDFEFDYTPNEDLNMIPLCKIAGGVKVFGEYEIFDDDSVEINLKLRYKLEGKCSYCLKDAQKVVECEFPILFVTEQDGDYYYYDGIKLNLKTAVDDAILMSQPNVLLCREGCEGIDVT